MKTKEQEYLQQYDINKYERPSIATDMVVFTIVDDKEEDNYRKLSHKHLKILLIQRGQPPFQNMWALPGGFCKSTETVYQAAQRELKEETNTDRAYLELCGVFSEQGRDPRGWIISQAFMALLNSPVEKLRAGGDAWEAKWFEVSLKKVKETNKSEKSQGGCITTYRLELKCDNICLWAEVEEEKLYQNYHASVDYKIISSEGIGFDHGKIITYVLKRLRDRVEEDGKIVFDLLPELFTLTDLQKAFEIILDKPLLAPNFRRKIAKYVVETEETVTGGGHRPAKLFRRNLEEFYR